MIKKTFTTALLVSSIITSAALFNEDNSTIANGKLVESDQTANVSTNSIVTVSNCPMPEDQFFDNYITEFFIIESVENGILKGKMASGTGEGIYFNLNEDKEELSKHDILYSLKKNDVISISWNMDSYNNEEWLDIYKVVLVKSNEEIEGAKQ